MTFFSTADLNKANSSKKPKLLVVDDEQDNLDLLYRTFRKDFLVFRADSGFNALKILEREGEMAAIISDQRMPEMNGTEFLSRTVSDFPDTMRIVLTGYTDITDLIEAINSGQVHKYITKPWEPEHLKLVVVQATQTYDVLKQRSEELSRSQAQNALLSSIVEIAQNSQQLSDCVTPLAEAFSKNFGAAIATLQLIEHDCLTAVKATCGDDIWDLTSDSLVQTAIATGKSQFYVKCDQGDQSQEDKQQFKTNFKTNLAIAITFRKELLGILSMQWRSPDAVNMEDIVAIQQYASKVAIALTCIRHYSSQS
jgi:CheY-like chemotaxis protein